MDKKEFYYTITVMVLFVIMILMAGCSHNPAVFTIGEQIKVGTTEYGEISWLNGVAIIDCSRENSSWEMEVDETNGIQYDSKTGTVKGIRKIKRTIGPQVSGYLVDLAKRSPEVAQTWVNNVQPAPLKKRKGQGNQNLNSAVEEKKPEEK